MPREGKTRRGLATPRPGTAVSFDEPEFAPTLVVNQVPPSKDLNSAKMPASLASLPGELHARIASMCALQDERFKYAKLAIRSPTFPLADPEPAERWTTVGALSVVSKYWNKVTEPYRFSVRASSSRQTFFSLSAD